jgi:hypothetical protein
MPRFIEEEWDWIRSKNEDAEMGDRCGWMELKRDLTWGIRVNAWNIRGFFFIDFVLLVTLVFFFKVNCMWETGWTTLLKEMISIRSRVICFSLQIDWSRPPTERERDRKIEREREKELERERERGVEREGEGERLCDRVAGGNHILSKLFNCFLLFIGWMSASRTTQGTIHLKSLEGSKAESK